MSFKGEMDDFIKAYDAGARINLIKQQTRKSRYDMGDRDDPYPPGVFQPGEGGPGVGTTTAPTDPKAPAQVTGGAPAKGGKGMRGDDLAWQGASPEQRALLNTIAGPESGGRYDVIYGGKDRVTDFRDHPRKDVLIQTGPNAKRTSSAAGKYQFIGSTWDGVRARHPDITDFSPENQDKAAWYLAEETYKQKTGRDLTTDLKSGDPNVIAGVGPALKSQWTSLPGGIEQGTTVDKFVSTFQKNLQNAPAGQPAAATVGDPPMTPEQHAAALPVIPDGEGEQPDPDPATESPDFTVPEVDPNTEMEAPQVADEFNQGNGLYAQGGVIPDDTQSFAEGGMPVYNPKNPSAIKSTGYDKYNTDRDYTQPIKSTTGGAGQPRRISFPTQGTGAGQTPNWRSWSGGSPAQLALRKGIADRAAAQPAPVAAAPVAAPAPVARKTAGPISGSNMVYAPGGGGSGQQQFFQIPMWRGPNNNWAKGGKVPTNEDYARRQAASSRLPDRDKRMQELWQQESRSRSQHSDDGGESARDRAARRLSAEEGRPSSTAYLPSRQAPDRSRFPAAPKLNVPHPTPRPGPGVTSGAPASTFPARPEVISDNTFNHTATRVGHVLRDDETGATTPSSAEGPAQTTTGTTKVAPTAEGTPPKTVGTDKTGGYKTFEGPPPKARMGVKITIPGTKKGPDDKSWGDWLLGYAEGGAIPDDDRFEPRTRNVGRKAEQGATYRAKPKQTKSATKQRPKSTTKQQARNQPKRAKPKFKRTPSNAPTPTPRPDVTGGVQGPPISARLGPQQGPPASAALGPQQGPPASAALGPQQGPPIGARMGPQQGPPMSARLGPQQGPPMSARLGPQQGPPSDARIGGPPSSFSTGRPDVPVPPNGTPGQRYREDIRQSVPSLGGPANARPPQTGAGPAQPQGPPMSARVQQHERMRPYDLNNFVESESRRAADEAGGQPPPDDAGPRIVMGVDPDSEWLARDEAYKRQMNEQAGMQYARGGAIPDEEAGPYPKHPAEGAAASSANTFGPDDYAGDTPNAKPSTRQGFGPNDYAGPVGGGQVEVSNNTHPNDIMRGAAGAVKIGLTGLQNIFGLSPQGAVPTEEDDARTEQGTQRFASGEGAATSQEVQAIDHSFGIDQMQADEGMKNLMRIDQTVQYYLMRGDKDKAEAVSASLLQYGARRVGQLGTMAQAAFEHYQETGDPNDLQNASKAIQMAHQMVPDGFNIKIDVDPKTHQIVATTVGPDGKQQQQVVDPMAVPGLLKHAMDGSEYWNSVFQVGQPDLAAKDAAAKTTAANAAQAQQDRMSLFDYEQDRRDKTDRGKENRAAARKLWEDDHALEVGKTENERIQNANKAYFDDWSQRMADTQDPAEQQKLTVEGLGYRYDNTPDRKQALEEDLLSFGTNSAYKEKFNEEDLPGIRDIARSIAMKNGKIDAVGAMEAAGALILSPAPKVSGDGTLDLGGWSLVFNPALLPSLGNLHKKYGAQE